MVSLPGKRCAPHGTHDTVATVDDMPHTPPATRAREESTRYGDRLSVSRVLRTIYTVALSHVCGRDERSPEAPLIYRLAQAGQRPPTCRSKWEAVTSSSGSADESYDTSEMIGSWQSRLATAIGVCFPRYSDIILRRYNDEVCPRGSRHARQRDHDPNR